MSDVFLESFSEDDFAAVLADCAVVYEEEVRVVVVEHGVVGAWRRHAVVGHDHLQGKGERSSKIMMDQGPFS